MKKRILKLSFIGLIAILLNACSGSGSSGGPSDPPASVPTLIDQVISFENPTEQKALFGDVFENPLSKEGEGVVSYVSSDEQVASVDSTGIVSVVGEGEAMITATVAAGVKYKAATANFNLSAIKPSIEISGWVGNTDSHLSLPSSRTSLNLYFSNEIGCDIANYAACLNGSLFSLGDDSLSIINPALKLSTPAYVKAEFGENRIDSQISSAPLIIDPYHKATVFRDKLWLIGESAVWNSNDGLNWEKVELSESFGGRLQFVLLNFNDHLWLITGRDGPERKNDVWRTADGIAWEQVTTDSGIGDRILAQGIVHDNKMWLIGGLRNHEYLSDIWSSSDGINWTQEQVSGEIFSPRSDFQLISHDGAMWVIGGESGYRNYENDVWKSSDGISWQKVTQSAAWTARHAHQVLSFDNKLWLIGGSQNGLGTPYDNGDFDGVFNDVWNSIDGIEWFKVEGSERFITRGGHSAVVFNDEIFVTGGFNFSSGTSDHAQNDVWSSGNGASWQRLTVTESLPPRTGNQVVEFKDKLWSIAGDREDSYLKNDIWNSDDGIQWNQAVANAEFKKRIGHQVTVFDDKIWLFGGISDNNREIMTNEIWTSSNGIEWKQETSTLPYKACGSFKVLTLNDKLWMISLAGREYETTTPCLEDDREMWVSDDGINWADVKDEFNFPDLKTTKMVVYQDKIWAVGNLDINDYRTLDIEDVWSFDGSSHWKVEQANVYCGTAEANCFQRAGHRLQVFKDKMWLVGRDEYSPLKSETDVWSSTDGKLWTLEVSEANYLGTTNSPMVVFKNKMMIVGGLYQQRYRMGQVWSTENGVDWKLGYQHTLKFEKEAIR